MCTSHAVHCQEGPGLSEHRRRVFDSTRSSNRLHVAVLWQSCGRVSSAPWDDSPGFSRGSVCGAPARVRLSSWQGEGWSSFAERRSAQGCPLQGQQAVDRKQERSHTITLTLVPFSSISLELLFSAEYDSRENSDTFWFTGHALNRETNSFLKGSTFPSPSTGIHEAWGCSWKVSLARVKFQGEAISP